MSFIAAGVGVGSSLVGGIFSSRSANKASARQAEEMAAQRRMQEEQFRQNQENMFGGDRQGVLSDVQTARAAAPDFTTIQNRVQEASNLYRPILDEGSSVLNAALSGGLRAEELAALQPVLEARLNAANVNREALFDAGRQARQRIAASSPFGVSGSFQNALLNRQLASENQAAAGGVAQAELANALATQGITANDIVRRYNLASQSPVLFDAFSNASLSELERPSRAFSNIQNNILGVSRGAGTQAPLPIYTPPLQGSSGGTAGAALSSFGGLLQNAALGGFFGGGGGGSSFSPSSVFAPPSGGSYFSGTNTSFGSPSSFFNPGNTSLTNASPLSSGLSFGSGLSSGGLSFPF